MDKRVLTEEEWRTFPNEEAYPYNKETDSTLFPYSFITITYCPSYDEFKGSYEEWKSKEINRELAINNYSLANWLTGKTPEAVEIEALIKEKAPYPDYFPIRASASCLAEW